jgi:hypothetical protein
VNRGGLNLFWPPLLAPRRATLAEAHGRYFVDRIDHTDVRLTCPHGVDLDQLNFGLSTARLRDAPLEV